MARTSIGAASNTAPALPVTYRNATVVIPAGAAFLGVALLSAGVAADRWHHQHQRSWTTILLVTLALLGMISAARLLMLGLTLTETGLIVRNPFRTSRLSWDEVEGFRIEKAANGPYGPAEAWTLLIDRWGYDPLVVAAAGGKRYLQEVHPRLEATRTLLVPERSNGRKRSRYRAPSLPITYRNLWSMLPMGVAFGYLALFFGWMILREESSTSSLVIWQKLLLYPFAPLCAFLAVRLPLLELKVTEAEVIVRNVFRTRRLRWEQVRGFRVKTEILQGGQYGPRQGFSFCVLMSKDTLERSSPSLGSCCRSTTCA